MGENLYLCGRLPKPVIKLVAWIVEVAPVGLRALRLALVTADLPPELAHFREPACDWIEKAAAGCGGDVLAVFPSMNPDDFASGCAYFRGGRF